MKNAEMKKAQFHTELTESYLPSDVEREVTDEILEKAFDLIKEGIINQTINCTLDGDLNTLDLDTLLNEKDWDEQSRWAGLAKKQQEEEIEHAKHYLGESDTLTMGEQIEALEAQAEIDGTVDAATVEGVSVWEQMQGHSVDYLLDLICV